MALLYVVPPQTVSLSLTDPSGTQNRGWITMNLLLRLDEDRVAVRSPSPRPTSRSSSRSSSRQGRSAISSPRASSRLARAAAAKASHAHR